MRLHELDQLVDSTKLAQSKQAYISDVVHVIGSKWQHKVLEGQTG